MGAKHNRTRETLAGGKERKDSMLAQTNAIDQDEVLRKLRESEERYRSLVMATTQIIWTTSGDGWSSGDFKAWCAYTGQREEEQPEKLLEAVHPDDRARVSAAWLRAVEAKAVYEMEYRLRRFDGEYRIVAVRGVPVFEADGNVREWVGTCTDITERRRAEEERDELLRREAAHVSQLEAILGAITDLITVYDSKGNILYANDALPELVNKNSATSYHDHALSDRMSLYEPRDEHGHPLAREQWPITRFLRGEVLRGKDAADIILRTAHGRDIQANISGAPIYDAEGHIIGCVAITRDVTERRQLERRTQETLEGLLTMAEALVQIPESADNLYVVGRRLATLTCNVLGCQRVGIVAVDAETEMLYPVAVVGLSAEQERAWWEEQRAQQQRLDNGSSPELIARLRANDILVFDMSEPPYRGQPNPYNIKTMLIAPMNVSNRLVGLLTLDYGETEHEYTSEEIALAGTVAKLSALVIERQRLLVERAEAQGRELALREANNRMEEFLGIASHELRTPLTTIKANIQLAMRRLKVKDANALPSDMVIKIEAVQDMLTRAERQVGVLNRLVGDLIDISRIRTGKLQVHLRREPGDLAEIVREAVQEQRKATPNRTIILHEIPEDIDVPVIADADRIAQVITNYLGNALKYSASDTPVEVQLTIEPEQARVAVRDYGPGLSEPEQQRVWECFYQVEGIKVQSGSGVGLGLGLHISQTIIDRHHGQVGVESQPGEGSVFWFTLPLAHSASAPHAEDGQ